jgi:mRNA interferase MazF
VERPVTVQRPALVISNGGVGPDGLLLWTAMITNARREPWPGDVFIPHAEELGLIIPSKVRTAKINAVETKTAARIGELDGPTWGRVLTEIRRTLGL